MSDALRRGLRTLLQLVVTLAGTGATLKLLNESANWNVTAEQWAIYTGVLLPVVTSLQNALEDAGKIPALLKAPASDGQDPVPDTTHGLQ